MFPYLFTRIPYWSVDPVPLEVKRASTDRAPPARSVDASRRYFAYIRVPKPSWS